jgi:hypothetical protein
MTCSSTYACKNMHKEDSVNARKALNKTCSEKVLSWTFPQMGILQFSAAGYQDGS